MDGKKSGFTKKQVDAIADAESELKKLNQLIGEDSDENIVISKNNSPVKVQNEKLKKQNKYDLQKTRKDSFIIGKFEVLSIR
jgi:regulatory protein YycI of two-component signal transduction system YycFG